MNEPERNSLIVLLIFLGVGVIALIGFAYYLVVASVNAEKYRCDHTPVNQLQQEGDLEHCLMVRAK